jgi:hypothetical protein
MDTVVSESPKVSIPGRTGCTLSLSRSCDFLLRQIRTNFGTAAAARARTPAKKKSRAAERPSRIIRATNWLARQIWAPSTVARDVYAENVTDIAIAAPTPFTPAKKRPRSASPSTNAAVAERTGSLPYSESLERHRLPMPKIDFPKTHLCSHFGVPNPEMWKQMKREARSVRRPHMDQADRGVAQPRDKFRQPALCVRRHDTVDGIVASGSTTPFCIASISRS